MDVNLPVELTKAVLLRREEYPYRDWLLLRAACEGSGHCRMERYKSFLKRQGYRRTAIAESIQRLLDHGLAASRRTRVGGHEVLLPLSLRQMLDRYQLNSTRWHLKVPLTALKGQGLRGLFFGYVQAVGNETPIARSTLRSITNVSVPTQLRGERRAGIAVKPNYITTEKCLVDRLTPNAPRLLGVAEGREGHLSFRRNGKVYLQGPNSYSHATLTRSKRVVYCSHRNCCDNRAQQPTDRRRYYDDYSRATKRKVWRIETDAGTRTFPVLVKERSLRFGGQQVGAWGIV